MDKLTLGTRNVSIEFPGVKALTDVNFEVSTGEIRALVGANGAGKSTLMKVFAGANPDYTGEVYLNDKVVELRTPMAAKKLGIQIVYQEVDMALVPTLSVAENVMLNDMVMSAKGKPLMNWAQLRTDAKRVLEKLHIDVNVRTLVQDLSLAQKQMVLIARAIANECNFLILDEPTNGLDPIGIAEVRNFIKNLSVERGKTILISSHILSEISLLADDIGIIDHGVLLEESSMEELEKKNRKYIQLQVSDIPKASLILERQFHVTDYAVQDEHNLRLYDTALDMAAINKALVVQDVAVISSQICNDTLEDYFKQITGGEGIA